MVFNNGFLHVKWFTEEEDVPLVMQEVITPEFLFWLSVTLVGLLVSSIFNEPLQRIGFIRRIHLILDRLKPWLTMILRIGLGLSLMFQLFTSAYLAPELITDEVWVKVLLVIAILALFNKRTLGLTGVILLVLYGTAVYEHGWFHILDYVFYIGISYYLFVSETKWKATATPVLYLLTGFSLAWVGLEKMVLPQLAYHIVEQFHVPTFGFSVEAFVLISAFIELGLAWTFIVGILNRFISIIVTLVFITTTTVFGFTEIVGHTVIHTLLIMFLIEGEGTFKTPFQFHHRPLLRYTFVLVNFCVLLFGLMWIYISLAQGS